MDIVNDVAIALCVRNSPMPPLPCPRCEPVRTLTSRNLARQLALAPS